MTINPALALFGNSCCGTTYGTICVGWCAVSASGRRLGSRGVPLPRMRNARGGYRRAFSWRSPGCAGRRQGRVVVQATAEPAERAFGLGPDLGREVVARGPVECPAPGVADHGPVNSHEGVGDDPGFAVGRRLAGLLGDGSGAAGGGLLAGVPVTGM